MTEYEITTHPDGKQFIRIEDKWIPVDVIVRAWADGAFRVGNKIRRVGGELLDLPTGFVTVVEGIDGGGYIYHNDATGHRRSRHSDEYELI